MPTNDLSQIINHAKKLHARAETLQRGCDRRDADIAELRAELVREKMRFQWPEFVLGAVCAAVIGGLPIIASILLAHHA